jgi:leucyl-tRNA synthetase
VQRDLEQWFYRITDHAESLLAGLDGLPEWPEKVKVMQRNWIGRSEGAEIEFAVPALGEAIKVFTTRPDTLHGATFLVLAPEHPLAPRLIAGGPRGEEIAAWIERIRNTPRREREEEGAPKVGRDTGRTAINPATGEAIPIWLANYVLPDYGTGAIMAVPAHDARDFAFARAFELPMRCVVEPTDGRGTDTTAWDDAFVSYDATMVNSANDGLNLDGMGVVDAKAAVTDWLAGRGIGEGTVNYRLRDWLFSRQRYWGEPFPIVYDEEGTAHAVPDAMLPVELPEVDDYSPRTFDPDDADTSP